MKLTKAQQNLLSIVVEGSLKSRGKNKGQLKGVVSSASFDGRSFGGLVDKGLVEYHDGVFGSGFVATPAGGTLILG